jgi:iron(II)-dependent oxidoreductase
MNNKQSIKCYLIIFLLAASQFAYAERVKIPAGEFAMGCSINDDQCENDEGKPGGEKINVTAFYLDSHEVTVQEYSACIDAEKCQTPKNFDRNQYCNLNANDRGNHPINCVNWQDAADYCEWKGGNCHLSLSGKKQRVQEHIHAIHGGKK